MKRQLSRGMATTALILGGAILPVMGVQASQAGGAEAPADGRAGAP